ncbi:PrGVORF34 [Pieris rapae granulovirus Wuhan]|uniref:PrGVORF34 n=1 Tax=Pieris rapae granulovirus Wuhan TaxID=2848030 RepID=D2J4K1_9BBAC|nr:PrGVORF34 [Betabaculovirus arrapae]ACZ63520.1 PrGVORF34 [Betabaculovirus arrapae]AGS18797.1 hypothetical protein [Pieris rapae granulovirus]UOS85708.1 hypothetical protein [Pieris rapae granulovirus]
MDLVFAKKNAFFVLAKQLNSKELKIIKPFVDEIYNKIHLYCVTRDQQILRLLYYFLCKCNILITTILLNKTVNSYKLYSINE